MLAGGVRGRAPRPGRIQTRRPWGTGQWTTALPTCCSSARYANDGTRRVVVISSPPDGYRPHPVQHTVR
jgi:hypothetical protein